MLGKIYLKQNKIAAANTQFLKAIALAEKYYAKTKLVDYSKKFRGLAEVKEASGENMEALNHYQKALQILAPGFTSNAMNENPAPDSLFSKIEALEVLNAKGNLLWSIYQLEKEDRFLDASYHTFKDGIQLIDNIRQGVLTIEAKNIVSEKNIMIYEGAIRSAIERYEKTKEKRWMEEAFIFAESNKSLALLESVQEQVALGMEGLPDSLLQRDKELRLSVAFYQKRLIEEEGKKDAEKANRIKEWKSQLFEAKDQLQQLTNFLELEYPRFYDLKYKNDIPAVKDWQSDFINSDQALIAYFVGNEKIYGFVLWAQGLAYFIEEEQEPLFVAINQLKNSISAIPNDTEVQSNYLAFTNAGHTLYHELLAPLLTVVPKEIHSLKIIPDDKLNHIPFELLLMEKAPDVPIFSMEQLQYVMEEYNVSYDYSATWLLRNNENTNRENSKNLIAFAPSFPKATEQAKSRSCQAGQVYELECSEEEVSKIQALVGGKSWFKEEANKSNFAKEASDYRIIHMATHACADEANPLFNKIFLTDDYLSNADLYNTNLNAELVVLSACNTGSGKLIKGEGVLSLARGFVQAGCASSIVSRWSVDDFATSEIMYLFYEGIKSGLKKDEALKNAKLDYLKAADPLHAHPYYWSAFVAYGNMEAMDLNTTPWFYYVLGVGILSLLGFFFLRKQ